MGTPVEEESRLAPRTRLDVDRAWAIILTLAVGGFVALQAPANAVLGRLVSDLGAAFVSLVISTAIVAVLLVTVGDPSELRGIRAFKPEHAIGGLAGAAIVVVTLVTVRELGAGGVTAALVAMQLIVSAVLDRLGVLGLERAPLGWRGSLGIMLLLGGTMLVTTR
jgi:transporter family-2 protein